MAKKQGVSHNLRYILCKKHLGCRAAKQVEEYHSWWLKPSNGDVYVGRHCKHVPPSQGCSFFWVISSMGCSRLELTLGIIINYDFCIIPPLLMLAILAILLSCLFWLWYWRPSAPLWYMLAQTLPHIPDPRTTFSRHPQNLLTPSSPSIAEMHTLLQDSHFLVPLEQVIHSEFRWLVKYNKIVYDFISAQL